MQTPVIPRCVTAGERADPNAQCSNGAITFWTPGGRERYNALLVKLDKRFSDRYLFGVWYALTHRTTVNGISNLDNYFANYGPDRLDASAEPVGAVRSAVERRFGVISAMASRGPVMPTMANVDLDGDGMTTTPIPGVDYNCFNHGCNEEDLTAAVAAFNQQYHGSARRAQPADPAACACRADFEFGDTFSSQDVRVTKTFALPGGNNTKMAVFVEVFNIFNVANLGVTATI